MDNKDGDIVEYNDYAALIYKHPDIELQDVNNFRSVRATRNIKTGELLILEHVFSAKSATCHLAIENNEALFNLYHPRITSFAETKAEDKTEQTKQKLSHNCFGVPNGNKVMNIYLQQINHSCTASCGVYIREDYTFEGTNVVFMELYAIKNIEKDTEITINYGPDTSHNRDFKCDCGLEIEKRQMIFSISSNLARTLSFDNNKNIKEKIFKYLQIPISKKILLNQFLAINGIFVNNNIVSCYTQEGVNMINNVVHSYLGINGDIKTDDGKVIEDKINRHKLNIFMHILNEGILLNSQTKINNQTEENTHSKSSNELEPTDIGQHNNQT
ncbi:SET domain-containing protein-lysine N-methyltransferase [Tupanvirus soda lake]|uniref:SET domain-containing protein-lysine N-methyltransferase n=2 Tax=Tupanvirus TaxID=2094720 RepID=A0A6N1NWG0_9VIRU|nr:SET domain-containing protein-lysine N-methyltransferase [Tupanvirus soda lake]QKU35573.1 SET domain-containing protein-lysine N-methyltransferase [Tupanvirus soda lake]